MSGLQFAVDFSNTMLVYSEIQVSWKLGKILLNFHRSLFYHYMLKIIVFDVFKGDDLDSWGFWQLCLLYFIAILK